ncbi:MAG: ABC transporter ATP-binding protein [Elusimicrobiota bacterium]
MLDIDKLTCGYGSKVVLRDISFNVNSGEIIGIVGPNGSGKTTMLRAITAIINPVSGTIRIDGKDTSKTSIREMARRVAVVSQGVEDSYMTVEEFVLMGRIPYYGRLQFFETSRDEELAAKYMEMSGISKLKDHALKEISGGERQLAMIARALCQETKLILLDEPTAHLDISHQSAILDLIRELKKEHGITVVMVLHDLNLASEYCDRLVLINNGRVHSAGEPGEVLSYKNIEEVYKTVVVVKENPVSKKPHVFVVSKDSIKNEF